MGLRQMFPVQTKSIFFFKIVAFRVVPFELSKRASLVFLVGRVDSLVVRPAVAVIRPLCKLAGRVP
jgi:hypothetical protein